MFVWLGGGGGVLGLFTVKSSQGGTQKGNNNQRVSPSVLDSTSIFFWLSGAMMQGAVQKSPPSICSVSHTRAWGRSQGNSKILKHV